MVFQKTLVEYLLFFFGILYIALAATTMRPDVQPVGLSNQWSENTLILTSFAVNTTKLSKHRRDKFEHIYDTDSRFVSLRTPQQMNINCGSYETVLTLDKINVSTAISQYVRMKKSLNKVFGYNLILLSP